MCGIWALFGYQCDFRQHCENAFTKIDHRGPDAWILEYTKHIPNSCLGFHRLTIVGSAYGMQPMTISHHPHIKLICNGELYNYKQLAEQYDFEYQTCSDVECIIHLYEKFGIEECVKNLDGVFAFCLVDIKKQRVYLGRDPYGVRPLFRLNTAGGMMAVSSEAKGLTAVSQELNGDGKKLQPFRPGTFEEYELFKNGTTKLLRQEPFHLPGDKPTFKPFFPYQELSDDSLTNIRELFYMAIRKRLMSDYRIGCLLSGGLDSSLVASILVQEARKAKVPYTVQTFSIGMEDSPDVKAAREVARHIGSEHHEVIFTEDDIKNVLDDVIYHLETPDITTIRASIGMYLVAKYIKENTDTRVVFSGEGADELCQGYIYFRDAPSPDAAHEESLRLLREIYLFDGLRADRTTSAQSLELRVPFLDLQFTNYFLSLPKEMRQPKGMKLEKFLLRSAFEGTNILPHHILWRHKEAFSDGVASAKKSLFTILQEIIDSRITQDFSLEEAQKKYPHCTPKTKESLYYRETFESKFPKLAENFIPFYWMPRWINVQDPSARYISHYTADDTTE